MKRIVFIIAVVALGLITVTACGQKKEKKNMTENKTLVAYFSATGTTESLAKKIATATGGELYKITPEAEYSAEDLDWTVETSRCCKENADPSSRPAFVKTKENLDAYDVVYLGFPNWWNGAPRIINTFIEAYGLKGKTVILPVHDLRRQRNPELPQGAREAVSGSQFQDRQTPEWCQPEDR